MADTTKKKQQTEKKNGAEKPVSLYGPKYEDVLRALLNTKPVPNEKAKAQKKKSGD
jgi:hypothetical protein